MNTHTTRTSTVRHDTNHSTLHYNTMVPAHPTRHQHSTHTTPMTLPTDTPEVPYV